MDNVFTLNAFIPNANISTWFWGYSNFFKLYTISYGECCKLQINCIKSLKNIFFFNTMAKTVTFVQSFHENNELKISVGTLLKLNVFIKFIWCPSHHKIVFHAFNLDLVLTGYLLHTGRGRKKLFGIRRAFFVSDSGNIYLVPSVWF